MSPTKTSTLRRIASAGVAAAIVVSGFAAVGASLALTATPAAAAAAPCNEGVSTLPGTVQQTPSGTLIVGVTAGTQIEIDCNASSGAVAAVEASLLGGIGTTTVIAANEADLGTLTFFPATASATDTGCPAATAGSCKAATLKVPATFPATDTKAKCPPTQAQINAGLFGCAGAVVDGTLAPITGGEFLMTYGSQTTPPNAPTISAAQTTGVAGDNITISDASGNTGYWWGDAIQAVQAALGGTTPTAAPSTCGTGGGYGKVPPSPFLAVNWFASGSPTPIAGSAAGVTISNDCYDGTTLHAPVLGGTIPVPSTVTPGTTYTAYLCEVNGTPYPSNDTNFTTNCGTAPAPVTGENWIDASFTFTTTSAPTVTSVSPASGSTAGGTSVTIIGTNFTGATAVDFGSGNAGTNVTVVSATEITVTSPAGTAGTVNVTVTTPGGTSATSSADDFTYVTPPTAPGAPTGLTATSGNTSVALAWTAPTSNGGSSITGYNVFEGMSTGTESTTPVNGTTLISGTSFVATGLTNGTTYYFTVKAVNAVGSSTASTEASATPAVSSTTPPGAPKLPFTGTVAPDGSVWLGVILLGLVLSALAAARVLREGRSTDLI